MRIINALRMFLGTLHGKILSGFLAAASVVLAPAVAFAQTTPTSYGPTNAQSDVTTFAGSTFASVAPMVTALAGALIGIVLLVWGVRVVLHKVRGVSI